MDIGSITYYSISPRILHLLGRVHERLGAAHARHFHQPAAELAKAYRASIVSATLAIEGGQLDPLPVAALAEDHTASSQGPAALEALNTHRTYDLLNGLDPFSDQDLRHAHGVLMHGLAVDAGHYRTGPIEVFYGDPQPLRTSPAKGLPVAVQELLRYAEEDDFPPLITACVLHFGLIYLRPFSAGNGRLARLWQRALLMRHWPVFAYLPVEAFIHRAEPAYHAALEFADRRGDCGGFIVYMLERTDEALAELLASPDPIRTSPERIAAFLQHRRRAGQIEQPFRRRDYMDFHPWLSTATATRDLKGAVAAAQLVPSGGGRSMQYRLA
ncbi:MAG: Fic family protein [Flavobacteriales bacterium]|jgi:Fic family protein|nr:MAG: Fic family protein [Flavobacteriales bacterium]